MIYKTIILIFIQAFIFTTLDAQLYIQHRYKPDELVRKKLVKANSGVKIEKVSYYGSGQSIAYFHNNVPGFEVRRGILLTTGYARDVSTPNRSSGTGVPTGYPGDRDLSRLVNNRTNDAAVLRIEFTPYTDSVQFRYFFASEEYPEYVDKGVNDVFAFFIRQTHEKNYRNLAHLPDGTPVTVDNINRHKNKEYYIPNKPFYGYSPDNYKEDREAAFRSQEFTFDGFTKELIAATRVEPYKHYELKIVIADVGDDIYDSGVFLEQGSFEAPNFKKMAIHQLESSLSEIKKQYGDELKVQFHHDTLVVTSHIAFEFDTYKINKKYNTFLTNLANMIRENENLILNINGHTDSVGDATYNMNLSQKRALSIANFLVTQGVERNRMKCFGYGSKFPVATDSTAAGREQNRRVEFQISEKQAGTNEK